MINKEGLTKRGEGASRDEKMRWESAFKITSSSFLSLHLPASAEKAPVDDGDVDGEEEDDDNGVKEAKEAENRLGDHVQRTDQVHDGGHHAEDDANAEHVHQPVEGEEVIGEMAQQGGQVVQVVGPLKGW